ncbi:hypothetical protein EAI89_09940 [Eubacterium sp. am_0171]|nr:hypothetical protein EAI89_09940 [Eubacterium sp. am_0171]
MESMKREGMAGVVDFVKGQDIYKGKGGFNIRIASFIRCCRLKRLQRFFPSAWMHAPVVPPAPDRRIHSPNLSII